MSSKNSNNHFYLLYGSQTGQAQAIAEEIEKAAFDQGLVADLFCLSETDKKFNLETTFLAVIVISTTGEGDPPETARKIWKRLKSTNLEENYLKHLRYSLLGLGDSNYGMFCNCPRIFDKRLEELGASRFYDTGYADDAKGLEIVVEPWIEGLWAAIKSELKITNNIIPISSSSCQLTNDVKTVTGSELLLEGKMISTSNDAIEDTGGIVPNLPIANAQTVPNLSTSIEPLSSSVLSLPPLTSLLFELVTPKPEDVAAKAKWTKPAHILSASDVIEVPVISCTELASHESVKKTLELCIDISDSGLHYEPGDAFGVYVPNDLSEVDRLLDRLNLTKQSEKLFTFKTAASPEQIGKRIITSPKHVPPTFSIRELFTDYLDIRAVLKKKFLRILSTYCSESSERRRLEELSSKEGGDDYTNLVVIPAISLLDILICFPSCNPPAECLIEHVPALLPRFYSAANSPLGNRNLLTFVFSVVEISPECGRQYPRFGVCTGWFYKSCFSTKMASNTEQTLVEAMSKIDLNCVVKVKLFMRKNNHFHLPDNDNPMILIGPGTGVAPFLGFLQHRQCQTLKSTSPIWLFFGCRHENHDFIYRNQLQGFLDDGVLSKLLLSFSRDGSQLKYVQDNIWLFREEVIKMINEDDASVFVCGDVKGMAKDVYETIVRCLIDVLKLSDTDARAYIRKMQDKKCYLTDVWI